MSNRFKPLTGGLGQRVMDRPSQFKSALDGVVRKAGFCGPSVNALCATAKRGSYVSSEIIVLLSVRRPATITRLVVAISIGETVQRVSRGRAISHVGEKVAERTFPAVTDRYAPPPIIGEPARIGVIASLDHRPPNAVFSAPAFTMSQIRSTCDISLKTPATFTVASIKTVRGCFTFNATVASAQPIASADITNYEPSSEFKTSNVFKHISIIPGTGTVCQ